VHLLLDVALQVLGHASRNRVFRSLLAISTSLRPNSPLNKTAPSRQSFPRSCHVWELENSSS
jgi:hypothetical protein